MSETIDRVSIDLLHVPINGHTPITVRVRPSERDLINRAAQRIGYNSAQFTRTVLVNAARAVMDADV